MPERTFLMRRLVTAARLRYAGLWLALAGMGLSGCGTVYIDQELEANVFNLGGSWVAEDPGQFHRRFALDRGSGTVTFGCRDAAGDFDVPSACAFTRTGVAGGEFVLMYRPSDALRKRYGEAGAAHNAGGQGGAAGSAPETLPEKEHFRVVIDRVTYCATFTSERRFAARFTAINHVKGRADGK
jgi:hypothetical protein